MSSSFVGAVRASLVSLSLLTLVACGAADFNNQSKTDHGRSPTLAGESLQDCPKLHGGKRGGGWKSGAGKRGGFFGGKRPMGGKDPYQPMPGKDPYQPMPGKDPYQPQPGKDPYQPGIPGDEPLTPPPTGSDDSGDGDIIVVPTNPGTPPPATNPNGPCGATPIAPGEPNPGTPGQIPPGKGYEPGTPGQIPPGKGYEPNPVPVPQPLPIDPGMCGKNEGRRGPLERQRHELPHEQRRLRQQGQRSLR